jgi:pimeloyl-ACP methyl ester carboxylesterase
MTAGLHVARWGSGERIVFVHGSFGWGEETFHAQRELADEYELLLLDRRGYGDSPPAERVDFGAQIDDIAPVLRDGAHLVGHSYGGLLALLAAAWRPDAILSLVLIEPAAFSVARGQPAVERLIERLAGWYDAAPQLSSERLYPAFLEAFGFDPPSLELTERDLTAAITTAREPRPWEAEVPLEGVAEASFPVLVVRGTWDVAPPGVREIATVGLHVICDVVIEATRCGERSLSGRHAQPAVARWAVQRKAEKVPAPCAPARPEFGDCNDAGLNSARRALLSVGQGSREAASGLAGRR